jgi:hypothetical protein
LLSHVAAVVEDFFAPAIKDDEGIATEADSLDSPNIIDAVSVRREGRGDERPEQALDKKVKEASA